MSDDTDAPRMGRPPLEDKRRAVKVYLTDEERGRVQRAAESLSLGLSEYAREALLDAAGDRLLAVTR